jgi:steroid delta-isomerase-like uncharacterized protein
VIRDGLPPVQYSETAAKSSLLVRIPNRRFTVSVEENKVAMRRIPLELFNQGKMEVVDEVVAPDYIEHLPVRGLAPNPEGFKQFVQGLRAAFPDFQYTLLDEISEGDRVVQRFSVHATQRGDYIGIPASGKEATWSEIHIARVENGKLVEHWGVVDQLSLLQQLGVIPQPEGAPA